MPRSIFCLTFLLLSFCTIVAPNEIDLILNALLKGLSELQNKLEVNDTDFSELQNLCDNSEDPTCQQTVKIIIRGIKVINDRQPNKGPDYTLYYYILVVVGLVTFKIIMLVLYVVRRFRKSRNRRTAINDATVESSDPEYFDDTELKERERDFIDTVKHLLPTPDTTKLLHEKPKNDIDESTVEKPKSENIDNTVVK